MHHSDVKYWQYLESLPAGHVDLPSPRVCRLLMRTFAKWTEKPLWLEESDVGHLFENRPDLSDSDKCAIAAKPVPVRKALAVRRMLEIITDPAVARRAGSFVVDPDELVLGTLPPFSVGQGKEFVRYLTPDERLSAMLNYLNELSPMGHVVPDHGRVVNRGLLALIDDCEVGKASADSRGAVYLDAVAESLRAVIAYAERYAAEADRLAALLPTGETRETLAASADRLRRVPAQPAESFHDAVQAIFIVHCALHWTVEVVPLGRLDQILQPFYEKDAKAGLTPEAAQEIIDCFWVKLDERVTLDRRHIENRFTACDGVLTGFWGASNYDQGCLINQWMQQITVGGVVADDRAVAVDACNDVTRLCLNAARRLPLNSPTLDLRVHHGTPDDVLELAARALLSGGAHPVLLHDDKIIRGLIEGGRGQITLAAARDYACDGCYETMVSGASEFSFGFVSAPDAIEKTLNRGASFAGSGPVHLRGLKDSWRSRPAADIKAWDEFWAVLCGHIELGCHRYIRSLLLNYGNKSDVAPSTLLSALIDGCVEAGRDITEGGARYRIFSPLLTGISTAADSLYVIKRLVFEENRIGIDELVTALSTDWGNRMADAEGRVLPAVGVATSQKRIVEIREMCESEPKFGFGTEGVDKLAWDLINVFCNSVTEAWRDDCHKKARESLQRRFGLVGRPFDILLIPGVGTFEQYVLSGSFLGASADGRRAGDPVASDLSPAPVHRDRPAVPVDDSQLHARVGGLADSFRSYANPVMARLGDGAATDYTLTENFPLDRLTERLRAFARGEGGSVATFTVADPKTLASAQADPQAHNLVRVRMGGWTEFFVCLFPDHQEQHRRRPLFVH